MTLSPFFHSLHHLMPIGVALLLAQTIGAFAETEQPLSTSVELAAELAREGDHIGAAIEFRRAAIDTDQADWQGACWWSAAHEYLTAKKLDVVPDILDKTEDAAPDLEREALLLRGEAAYQAGNADEAVFYFDSLARRDTTPEEMRAYARKRLARTRLQAHDPDAALQALASMDSAEAEAIRVYMVHRDKKPWLGGILGIIPGLGYVYSGEYSNAARSAILNGLFVWGMVATAEEDIWGGFAVITFFELTWYSGSIYGGIDAAHRYNRRRLENTLDAVGQHAAFHPDYRQLPLIRLRFDF